MPKNIALNSAQKNSAASIVVDQIKNCANKYGFYATSNKHIYYGKMIYEIYFKKFGDKKRALSIKYYIEEEKFDFVWKNMDVSNLFYILQFILDTNIGIRKKILKTEQTKSIQSVINCPACGAKYKNE